MKAEALLKQLHSTGFIHIPYTNQLSADSISSLVGKVILKTVIQPNEKSQRLLAGSEYIAPHTDHIAANFILWQCNSQAAIGGDSILIDGYRILNNAGKDTLDYLSAVQVNSHKIFYFDKPSYPLFSKDSQVIYYAPFLCERPAGSKYLQALVWFENQLSVADKIEIKLSEGDWLLIDNHRMLHGRNSFPADSGRMLTRYWIAKL